MHTSEYIDKTINFIEANPLDVAILLTFHHEYLANKRTDETFDDYIRRQHIIAMNQEHDNQQAQHEEASEQE